MKLRSARLCLDCDEVHDAYRCPACTSESFAYIARWVPEPDREERVDSRTSPSERAQGTPECARWAPEASAYEAFADDGTDAKGGRSALKGGLLGIAAVGLLGWLWGGRGKTHEW